MLVILLFISLNYYYYYNVEYKQLHGYYPMMRHFILALPVLFLSLSELIYILLRAGFNKTCYGLIALLLSLQASSDARILLRPTVPDSESAWKHIAAGLTEGDAVAVTPVPLFLFATLRYYIPPHATGKGGPYWADLASLTKESGRRASGESVLLNFSNCWADYPSMRNAFFVNRIWNVRYDFRMFGLIPEFGGKGEQLFDEQFSDWKLKEETAFPFVRVRLLEAPPVPRWSGGPLVICAGVNDLKFVRGVEGDVFQKAPVRRLTDNAQVLAPPCPSGPPKRIVVRGPGFTLARDVAPPGDQGAPAVSFRRDARGFIIPLTFVKGRLYRYIVLWY